MTDTFSRACEPRISHPSCKYDPGCVIQVRGYFVHMLGRLYQNQECSAARTLEPVGGRWSLLVLRYAGRSVTDPAITSACGWPSAGTIRILRLSRPAPMPRRGWTSLRHAEAPAGHTSHEECGRERGTDRHAVPPRCSGQLVQPGGGEQVGAGSGRRICPYQIHEGGRGHLEGQQLPQLQQV